MQLVDDDDIMSTAGSRDAGVTAEEQQCQCSSPSRALPGSSYSYIALHSVFFPGFGGSKSD